MKRKTKKPKINNLVAKHSHLAGKAGCHEDKKYNRKKKHKEEVTDDQDQ